MSYRITAILLITSIAVLALLTGCGVKGNPRPAAKVIIPAVDDLNAFVTNTRLTLRWSPALQYSDGRELDISSVEIYRLDEELAERLEQLRDDDKERLEEARRADRPVPRQLIENPALGPISSRIKELQRLRVEDFADRATLVASIPVEQLVEAAVRGRLNWTLNHGLDFTADMPASRSVFAIRQIDAEGRTSALSNLVTIYPVYMAASPGQTVGTLEQETFTLTWLSPSGELSGSDELPLAGYYIYKSSPGAAATVPVSYTLVEAAVPQGWTIDNAKGFRPYEDGLLLISDPGQRTFLAQMFADEDDITSLAATELQVQVTARSAGNTAPVSVILDFSRTGVGINAKPVNSDIFTEDDHPLIRSRLLEADNDGETIQFSQEVPGDAVAAQIRIEFAGEFNDPAPVIIESITITSNQTGNQLLTNANFSDFESISYKEPIKSFGDTYSYFVTAVYPFAGYYLESSPGPEYTVTFTDTFPPADPRGVIALVNQNAVSITWDAVIAEDLRGYRIYRRKQGEDQWQEITKRPITDTIYRDREIEPETTYLYRVTAVDKSGNESDGGRPVSIETLESN